jgi:hypothetical protein
MNTLTQMDEAKSFATIAIDNILEILLYENENEYKYFKEVKERLSKL